jgi:hypothetical protein
MARPGFDAGVEVEDIVPPAIADQLQAGHLHRQVEQEVALAHGAVEHALQIAFRKRLGMELDAVLRGDAAAVRAARNDAHLPGPQRKVAVQQRQDGLAYAAKAQHDDAPAKLRICFRLVHIASLRLLCLVKADYGNACRAALCAS